MEVIMGTTVKLRNVRITYPHVGVPDRYGKYSVGVLIKKGTPAHELFMAQLREAWSAAADSFGKAVFEPNPTTARLLHAAYVKDGDGVDSKGKALPEWTRGCMYFGVSSQKPAVVVDGNLEPVSPSDPDLLYTGQLCHVSLDLVPFNNLESHNAGFSRYLRSIVVLGGGEKIVTQPGAFTDAVEEWSE
jgi:hypothetical protein